MEDASLVCRKCGLEYKFSGKRGQPRNRTTSKRNLVLAKTIYGAGTAFLLRPSPDGRLKTRKVRMELWYGIFHFNPLDISIDLYRPSYPFAKDCL